MDKTIFLMQRDKEYEVYLYRVLTDEGYKVIRGLNAIELINRFHEIRPDIIISHYEMANLDGTSLYNEVMKEFPDTCFVFISSQKDIELITSMLMSKNCDFMVKPVVTAELLARIKHLMIPRDRLSADSDSIKVKDLELNLTAKKVFKNSEEISLTPTEFKLLEYLMYNKNKVLSRDAILNKVWGTSHVSDRVVDVYIGYLRDKMASVSKKAKSEQGATIETVPGFGYTMRE